MDNSNNFCRWTRQPPYCVGLVNWVMQPGKTGRRRGDLPRGEPGEVDRCERGGGEGDGLSSYTIAKICWKILLAKLVI